MWIPANPPANLWQKTEAANEGQGYRSLAAIRGYWCRYLHSQKPLGITARVGSSPTFGTKNEAKEPRRPFDDSDLACFSLQVCRGIGVSQCMADTWSFADWPMTNSNLPPTAF
jgi:hypothetical protein